MRPRISELRQWNPTAVSAAGDAATHAAAQLNSATNAFLNAVNAAHDWRGRTHDAATHRAINERDHADELRNILQQIADESKDAGTDLTHARDYVLQMVDAARTIGYHVTDTGQVSSPTAAALDDVALWQNRIQDGLTVVDQFDERYGSLLEALGGDLAATIDGQPDVTLPGAGRIDADDAVRWLQDMSQDERRLVMGEMSETDIRRLVQANPAVVGNLDGVPFGWRGVANEVNIRNALAEELRVNGETARANDLRNMLRQQNDPRLTSRMDALAGHNNPDDQQVERMFLTFENTPNGRVIEMFGAITPGTRNAAVMVPGTNTNLGSSGSNRTTAWNLARDTDGPVFFFLDGDLPQQLASDDPRDYLRFTPGAGVNFAPESIDHMLAGTAGDPHFAREMAPRLVAFGHELDQELAATAPGAHTTFIGHSYGGSVLGTAEQLGLRADNVLYASSAGTGIYEGGWHNPNPDVQRYSMTAPGDLIHLSQSLPGNPHGYDPDSLPGVTRLDTGFYADGTLVAGPRGHGDYWNDPESTAYLNAVDVITGQSPQEYVHRINDDPVALQTLTAGPQNWRDALGLPTFILPEEDSPAKLRVPFSLGPLGPKIALPDIPLGFN